MNWEKGVDDVESERDLKANRKQSTSSREDRQRRDSTSSVSSKDRRDDNRDENRD